MMASLYQRLRVLLIAGCVVWLSAGVVSAQMATVQEIMKQKTLWKRFAEEGRRLHFDARFQGRAADTFRVANMDLDFRLPSSIRLPDRMRDAQRMEITGKFVNDSGRLQFLVSALTIRDTDLEQLAKQVAAVPEASPDALLKIATAFEPIAEFYKDEGLAAEITSVRTQYITKMRKRAAGDFEQLEQALQIGTAMNADARLLAAIRFQLLLADWKRPESDLTVLVTSLQKLPGWDQQGEAIPTRLRESFPNTAVADYDAGTDAERQSLDRLLYSKVRQQQIKSQLKKDGSNGLMLAAMIRAEFPESPEEATAMEEREVTYRLGRIPDLNRQELQQLVDLLNGLSRQNSVNAVVSEWLRAQEKRFGTTDLAGLIRTADEHLFAAEQWKDTRHSDKGVDLLKQAWGLASQESPTDAEQMADRLKRLGWEHLNGQWLTLKQLEMLPKDDIQLAIREGRAVRGMTMAQVTSTLGKPARVSRVGSAKALREFWIYDDTGSAGLVVRFKRARVSRGDDNVVEDVSRIAAAP